MINFKQNNEFNVSKQNKFIKISFKFTKNITKTE